MQHSFRPLEVLLCPVSGVPYMGIRSGTANSVNYLATRGGANNYMRSDGYSTWFVSLCVCVRACVCVRMCVSVCLFPLFCLHAQRERKINSDTSLVGCCNGFILNLKNNSAAFPSLFSSLGPKELINEILNFSLRDLFR